MVNKKGFTLLELLVVVLIIGILASIALPQYRKAVAKSRATELMMRINDLTQAVDRLVLVEGFHNMNHNEVLQKIDIDVAHYDADWSVRCDSSKCRMYFDDHSNPHNISLSARLNASGGTWQKKCWHGTDIGKYVCDHLVATAGYQHNEGSSS